MRALAEFVMRGRLRAGVVAALGNLVPFLSLAVVGLVTLRKGVAEGLLVLLWATLPAFPFVFAGDAGQLLFGLSLALLLVTLIAAETLKLSVSWQQALLFVTGASGVVALLANQLSTEGMQAFHDYVVQVFRDAQQQMPSEEAFIPARAFVLGMVGYLLAFTTVIGLVIGRWWQAQLYNPGGFRAEFHQLRLGAVPATALLAAVLWCYLSSPDYGGWAGLLSLPLLLSAIGLVHYSVATMSLGTHWLVFFYMGLVMVGPLSVILVGLGFLDSIMNIRSRLSSPDSGRPDE